MPGAAGHERWRRLQARRQRAVLDEEDARAVRRLRRDARVAPLTPDAADLVDALAAGRVEHVEAKRAHVTGLRVDVQRAERQRIEPVAAIVEEAAELAAPVVATLRLSLVREQLHVRVVDAEERVPRAVLRMRAAPRRRTSEQRHVVGRCGLEIGDGDDDVV